jgi:hypothetical protein
MSWYHRLTADECDQSQILLGVMNYGKFYHFAKELGEADPLDKARQQMTEWYNNGNR